MNAMTSSVPVGRRLVLGSGVTGAFLLPRWFQQAQARPTGGLAPLGRLPGARRSPAPVVVLDPGHGGRDPGAIGVSGTYEKHIALAAALQLRQLLEAGGRYRVELTRGSDVFIPLEERVARAQNKGAALFVSMHADAVGDPDVHGASVYTLADRASDRQTAALARRENSADRFGRTGFRGATPEVADILASLVRQETRRGSTQMARSVVSQLRPDVVMLENPSRHAGFVVLKAADIPSVLIEMGFMSNLRDEAALRRPDHRVRVAQAMKRAVDAYFASANRLAGLTG